MNRGDRKRILAVLLAAGLAIGAGACGSSDTGTEEEAGTDTDLRVTQKEEEESSEGGTAVVTEEPATANTITPVTPEENETDSDGETTEEVSLLHPVQDIVYLDEWDDEGNLIYDSQYNWFSLDEEDSTGYKKLAKALDAYTETTAESMNTLKENLYPKAKVMGGDTRFVENMDVTVRRADASVFSFVTVMEESTSGSDTSATYSGVNFDASTGEELALEDVTTDIDALGDKVYDALQDSLGDAFPSDVTQEAVISWLEGSESAWTLDYAGLTVYLNPGVLSSLMDETVIVTVPFSGSEALFAEKASQVPNQWIMNTGEVDTIFTEAEADEELTVSFQLDQDGDGKLETTAISTSVDGNGWYLTDIIVTTEAGSTVITSNCWGYEAYLVHLGPENNYLYLVTKWDNDYEIMEIVQIDGEPVLISEEDNMGLFEDVLNDPARMTFVSRGDMLSTYSMQREYAAGEDGKPEALQDEYTIIEYEDSPTYILTTKQAMTLDAVDEDTGEVTEDAVELEKGSGLHLLYTDGESYVDASYDDKGHLCRIRLDDDSNTWPQTIDGVEIDDLFDGMLFAG